ncbi:MAG: RecQ family ATP-dependent DNA helicase, partial [Clostridiaceae bacterium]|nr:RecQ family ATP-dependent DNA helicase [Clostridiaceae bacterium]
MDKFTILRDHFGHTRYRSGQLEVIDAILARQDVLGIMPTGAGKSICYQVPALLLDGVTIVVSPLISLMKDQVNALEQAGIPAAFLNSSLSQEEYRDVMARTRAGEYKILYVAPERLLTDSFLALTRSLEISMVTVDEAHCISQWGQDFRPSYLRIVRFIEWLPVRPVVSAFTATATATVRDDIVVSLGLIEPLRITTGFDRENLRFEVRKPRHKPTALADYVRANREKAGIVYCTTRKTVEEVCEGLSARGFAATRYHAGLSEAERRANQDDFLYDRKRVMVATNAFGMGIDKSDVSYVIHYN